MTRTPASSGLEARRRRSRSRRPPLWVLIPALAAAALALVPLFYIVLQMGAVGWQQLSELLFRPRVGVLLFNTVRLTVAATVLCAVLGVSAAWCTERTRLPGRHIWGVLMALPITVPAFVNSYSWVSIAPGVQGFGGAVLVLTLSMYPLVYLPTAATLRGMDPALEETARSLGQGPWRVFFRVTLPQLRPALLGGALIVALHLLGEFGAFAMLRFNTFTTAIYEQYQLSFNGPLASVLATVLVALCALLLVADLRLRGRARYARLGSGAARSIAPHALGRATPLVLAAFTLLTVLALGVPLGSLTYWLLHGSSAAFPAASLLAAAGSSFALGLGAALLTVALALPVAILAVRYRSVLAVLVERSTYVAHALPGIVIALALVFVAVRYVYPLYQSPFLLIVAYAVLFLPLALIALRAAVAQLSPLLGEVARSLSRRPTVLWRVTLPLLAPGLGAAAALVFLSSVTELTATLLLRPTGMDTLATEVWTNTANFSYGAAAPYAALMVAVSALPTFLLTRKLGGQGE